jgi:UPF0755 protein
MKKLIVFLFVLAIVFLGLYFWWRNGLSPVDSADNSKKTFVVMRGEGTRQIADDLKKIGLIRDPIIFFLLIKKMGVDGKIQAGQFSLSPSLSATEVLEKLQVGTFDITVIIPEGKRAEEIADTLKYNFPNFKEEWRDKLNVEEGYLFPDTYSFPKDSDIDLIISKMKDNFDKKFVLIPDGRKDSLTQKEIVIISSLVEREAKYDEDRPLVASVILNRYKIGMKLDLDSTIQYALGYQSTENSWWKKSLTVDDLALVSAYNTYTNPGLPPGPISNPGLKALSAVIDAPETNYLYYVSDKNGNNHYAATLEEHNRNIKRYRVNE